MTSKKIITKSAPKKANKLITSPIRCKYQATRACNFTRDPSFSYEPSRQMIGVSRTLTSHTEYLPRLTSPII